MSNEIRTMGSLPEAQVWVAKDGITHNLCPRCGVDWDVLNNFFRSGGEERGWVRFLILARNCPECYKKFNSWIREV